MLSKFPKVRSPLPDKFKEIYATHFEKNREGKTPASLLSQKMESWLHKQVSRDVILDHSEKTTLEIGAGTLNQLQYEPDVGPYDIVEPFECLFKYSTSIDRIRNIYSDISMIQDNQKYDRITSIATFEHICNLPEVIAKSGILLKSGGVLRTAIPSEGTCLWSLGWKLTTGLEFRIKYGLDYGPLIKHEHVNTAREIGELLCYFFKNTKCTVFGLSKKLSFYQFYECTYPETDKCREYLETCNADETSQRYRD